MSAAAAIEIDEDVTNRQLLACKGLIQHKEFTAAKKIVESILKKYKPGVPVGKSMHDALYTYAELQRLEGTYIEAYRNYCMLIQHSPEFEQKCLGAIFECLVNIKTIEVTPQLELHLTLFLKSEITDNVSVEKICLYTLKKLYQFDNPEFEIELLSIATHKLLLTALPRLFLADIKFELFLTDLRQHLLNTTLQQGLDENLVNLVEAMAQRGFLNEYVNYISQAESDLIEAIRLLLTTSISTATDISNDQDSVSHLILTLCMYMPLGELPHQEIIEHLDLDNWPSNLRTLAQIMVKNKLEEQKISHSLATLSEIHDPVSKKVRQQYEGNPYPRWTTIPTRSAPFRYLEAYPEMAQLLSNPKLFSKQIHCLVAGGGTGRHPIAMAKNISNFSVTSLDLSRASLAYGARMAKQLGVNNIQFLQGDILDLHLLKKKFHIIESVGVLHHMQNPIKGLKVLLSKLRPKGILKLGLYSKLARTEIIKIRNANNVIEMAPSLKNIREFRHRLMTETDSILYSWPDFYSLSECRDLLFHEQEHQFSLPELKLLFEDHALNFLGFHGLSKNIFDGYLEQYPDDPKLTNLDNWHQLELENSHIFNGMYQFHCQKI